MKRFGNIAIWVFLSLVFVVVWGFTSAEHKARVCNTLIVHVDDLEGNFFIRNEDVEVILRQANMHPVGKELGAINLLDLEKRLDMIAEVKTSSVYKNLDGTVAISIKQRKPIVRIINAGGKQFYLDEDGYQMPLSENFTPRVPVVTGYINDPLTKKSAPEIAENPTLAQTVKSDEVYKLVSYIRQNPFWNAQVQQINFNVNDEIELIPTLGDHLILLGDLDSMERKLNKLKLFYTEGLNHADWNAYDTINIKYRNQIICTKK